MQGMSRANTRMLASGAKNIADIQAEYAVQAETFEAGWNKRSIGKNGDIMKRVMSHIETLVGEQDQLHVLDVACGTGICTRALAASALTAEVTGLDATEQMLSKARETEAEAEPTLGQTSVTYVQGDGAAMPFPDASFDLVTCRLAIHHFADPLEQVKEMARVCAPGGTVLLVDIVSPTDPATAARHNELEAMRDPSHTECKDTAGLVALLHGAGLNLHTHTVAGGEADGEYDNETVPNVMRFDNGMFVDQWLESTRTPAEAREAIRDQIHAEFAGGAATGMFPFVDDFGELCFTHKWEVVGARKEEEKEEVQQRQAQINETIQKDKDRVVDELVLEEGKKAVLCRCWKSAKFPYCDGAHVAHNKATGDNLGPAIVSAKK